MMPDDTHEKLIAKMLEDPKVRAEYERIEREEMPMLDMILAARRETGLTQAQVAERRGLKPLRWLVWRPHYAQESIRLALLHCANMLKQLDVKLV